MSKTSLHIGLNATAAVTGGGVTYWLKMIPAFARAGSPHRFTVLAAAGDSRITSDLAPEFDYERVRFPRPTTLSRLLWEQALLPRLLKRRSIDVLLAPADMVPLLCGTPMVMAVRNLNPYSGPRASTLAGVVRESVLRRVTRLSARRARQVFFVSNDSRARILPHLGIPTGKTHVIYHGVAEEFLALGREPSSEHFSTEPYLLAVSAVRNHKDFATLIEAFARLHESPEWTHMRLVIAGAIIDRPYHASLMKLSADRGVKNVIDFLGEIPYSALPELYRHASVSVLPTLAETFGHPLVEAMASAVPVVTTDLEVLREIGGNAADYYPPQDANALESLLRRLLVDRTLREDKVQAGLARAATFSWDVCARQTLSLLELGATGPSSESSGAQTTDAIARSTESL